MGGRGRLLAGPTQIPFTPKRHMFLGLSLRGSRGILRLRPCMEMQIPAKSQPLVEVGKGLLSSPLEMTPLPKTNCESGQGPSGMPRGRGRARKGGVGHWWVGP